LSRGGTIAWLLLAALALTCFATLPWTLARVKDYGPSDARAALGSPRYNAGETRLNRLPPAWWPARTDEFQRLDDPAFSTQRPGVMFRLLGTDELGRSLLYRCLVGGAISLIIGIFAATLAVVIGTCYGAIAGSMGGRIDALMMRTVDVLFGLPTILLVVLLAVASDALLDEYQSRARARAHWIDQAQRAAASQPEQSRPLNVEPLAKQAADRFPERPLSAGARLAYDLGVLVLAIGSVSWLSVARVVRGQVLSLKARPFMEAARALGVPWTRQFTRHLLPNLLGTIVVYATLAVPQAILQESFLSFLGIGVKPPLPSWGNLAASGLAEINPYRSHWWLLVFPCSLLAGTLLLLNALGESLRLALDPRLNGHAPETAA
jgi:oligopeptide transport system permease protein